MSAIDSIKIIRFQVENESINYSLYSILVPAAVGSKAQASGSAAPR